MNTRTPLFLLVSLALSVATGLAQSGDNGERMGAAFLLALGRAPTAAETAQWSNPGKLSVAELIAQLQPQGDDLKGAVAVRACRDALGREPSSDELKRWSSGSPNYTGLMKQHIQWLAEHPKDYSQVIERAYQLVMQRPAYTEEMAYWNAQSPLSFALLNACIENWARRNAPGLMATSGVATASVNSRWLTAIRLSPALAAEVRTATGLQPAGDFNLAAAAGRNVIAPGGGAVVSAGGINFVAAGR